MFLNQLYWDLVGFNPSGKEAEQTKMFKTVSEAQISAVKFCLDNYKTYMKDDVEDTAKVLNPDNKQAIAVEVKKTLDNKYNWYNWVVLVYNTDQEENYILYNMRKFPVGKIIVAVDYTLKAKEGLEEVGQQGELCGYGVTGFVVAAEEEESSDQILQQLLLKRRTDSLVRRRPLGHLQRRMDPFHPSPQSCFPAGLLGQDPQWQLEVGRLERNFL
ncbi:uncharacterized protein AKAME5_001970200 [Lates japonicus]|uniref:Uncharacterized protein n=1 Tax=Lates japonicus TaxID=270547 RepID=A0AAD3NBT8_LATJO|nr:uncharacterized protein AKAME5_001970200 [Lates japonicus]